MTAIVSVVIACRNAGGTLGVQLDALSRQHCPVPWNIVISDNGSSDATLAVARSYLPRLPGMIIVDSSQRAGAGHARNVGVAATGAPLLVFCDADDEAASGWLAAMVAALARDPFVAGRFESGRLNGNMAQRSRRLQQDDGLQESPFGPDLPHAGAGNLGLTRELFLVAGGFDPDVSCLEDTDLCWRIQLAGVPLVFCPDAVMHVRLRSSLRAMWAQGRAYGAAAALLAHRYRQPGRYGPIGLPELLSVTDDARPGRPGRGRQLIALIRERPSIGSVLWTVGWHLGRWRWHPSGTPASVQPLATPSRQAG